MARVCFFHGAILYIELQRISERSNILGDQYQKKQGALLMLKAMTYHHGSTLVIKG